jgi:hypothetical protein
VSITMNRPDQFTSTADLMGMVDVAARLAVAAGRADLSDRIGRARGLLNNRRIRVVVVGAPRQGRTSLVRALQRSTAEIAPGAAFSEVPAGPGGNQVWLPEPGSADVALFVSEADQQYNGWELDMIARLRASGFVVAGVISKIDLYPSWSQVQRANRAQLQTANLEHPSIPLLPVSAGLLHAGQQRGEQPLVAASGVPQLLEFLRDQISDPVDASLRDAVLSHVRVVADQLGRAWRTELDALEGAGVSPQERQDRAVAELDRRQQLSAAWQTVLNDGITELVSQVDFDLRERLREFLEGIENQIKKSNPTRKWDRFDKAVHDEVNDAVRANFEVARTQSQQLAERVAAALAGNRDGSAKGVALPKVSIAEPEQALTLIKPMDPPQTGGMFPRGVNSLRGAYGGVLMVGVLTSLDGLSLISPYSVGAGVLLGAFTFWEDRKNGEDRSKAEVSMAVAKLMDSVNFRVGDELRTQLRAAHRALRDHFTQLNDQLLRTAADSVRSAVDAAQRGDQPDNRAPQLRGCLTELGQLQAQIRATVPTR